MSNSFSAEVCLNEHRWNALEEALAKQGTSIEKYLQTYLVDLYQEMVPEDQVKEIEAIIHQENLEDQREREARKFSLHSACWKTEMLAVWQQNRQKSFWMQLGFCASICRMEQAERKLLSGKSRAAMKSPRADLWN